MAFVPIRCATLLVLLPAAALACGSARGQSKSNDGIRVTADQMHQLSIVKVETYSFLVQKSAFGQIAFNEDTSTVVLTPFPGRVTRLIASVGDKVKRGDPLLELDSPDVLPPQNDFIAAVTTLNKARSQLGLAQTVESRQKTLYQGKAGALKEWQQAQAQLTAAESDLRAAETALDAARNRLRIIGRSDADIAMLQEKGTISRTLIIEAPIDGTVIARKVGPGQYVRSDIGEALYTIADISTMWLKAFVPETDISFVQVGQEIEVKVGALPDRVFKARIATVGAASDAQTRRVVVRSEIPNPDGALKAEMFANFSIRAGSDPSPAVPIEAVIREGEQAALWVEDTQSPNLFRRRPVKLGIEQDGRIQLREGIKSGEMVVGRGAIFVDNEWKQ
jgi:cobalt-zinc-cadmium efflux system membrane fusion protein